MRGGEGVEKHEGGGSRGRRVARSEGFSESVRSVKSMLDHAGRGSAALRVYAGGGSLLGGAMSLVSVSTGSWVGNT